MSSALLDPPETKIEEHPVIQEQISLEDRIPPQFKMSRRTAMTVLGFGLIYAWYILKPLWHTDLWGHLAYGRYIWTTRTLPTTEPLMPLSQGIPFVDTAWLSQCLGYLTMQSLGVAGLQGLLALTVTATAVVVYHAVGRRTGLWLLAGFSTLVFILLEGEYLAIIRPQLAGILCASILLHRIISRRFTTSNYVLIPLLMMVWANLHGSFVVGLALLVTVTAGRGVDLLRRTGTLRSWFHDQTLRSWLVCTQLACVATLLNPYGLGLFTAVAQLSKNSNLQALTEWQPLHLSAGHGRLFLASAVAMVVIARLTPRRISTWEAVTLIGCAIGTLLSARFMIWWGLSAVMLGAVHVAAIGRRRWSGWRRPAASPVSGKWMVVSVGLCWIFFAYSPLGMRLLHNRQPNIAKSVSSETPLELVGWLKKHPPQGQIFNPYEWGDFLQWAGPPKMQVFLNSHAHLVPREVWLHYLQVVEQSADWTEVLDRYSINTVILDLQHRESLIRRLKDNAAWTVAYEDRNGVVFQRRKSI